MAALTLDDLFASPDHYLHSFEGDAALFVPMDRAAYHRSIFLDRRIQPPSTRSMQLPVAALTGHPARTAPTGWIFHVAHCGSTLLARALDDPALNLVLREPLALRQLGLQPDPARLRLVLAMLGKRYRAELPTIVKANVPVNFLLPELVAAEPEARAIFLFLDLPDYLLAILRNDGHREWLRNVTGSLARHLPDLAGASDAERAAALWAAQMRAFAGALAAWPEARSLDAEAFFAEPAHYLALAAERLHVPLVAAQVAAIVGGPLFATYSKNPQLAFDYAARVARRRELEASLAPEIDQARDWAATHAADAAAAMARIRAAGLGG
jgi:hypothetical protein